MASALCSYNVYLQRCKNESPPTVIGIGEKTATNRGGFDMTLRTSAIAAIPLARPAQQASPRLLFAAM
jgi:hypothetical protein